MKKLIAVTAILSVMFLGAGTSQALMGVPDAVPGRDVLVPFFIVSMDGFGNENTLIIITEVGGVAAVTGSTDVHLTVWNRDSEHVHDERIEYTARDVWFTDGLTLINKMSDAGRELCEVDLDGDTVNDHYIGYVYFDNFSQTNNLIAHAYQVDVGEGIVAGYIPPTLEDYQEGHDPMVQGYDSVVNLIQDFDLQDVEAFNANALWAAKLIELDTPRPVVATATNLMLYPRFYLHDELATNFLVVWTDEELALTPSLTLPGSLTINFYNEEEKVQSAPVIIDHELNIIDITAIVPDGLWTDPVIDWPHGGWIDLDIVSTFDARRYMLAYVIQRCPLDATTTLDVIFDAHRDADGTVPAP